MSGRSDYLVLPHISSFTPEKPVSDFPADHHILGANWLAGAVNLSF
jgi:hypothetical protein